MYSKEEAKSLRKKFWTTFGVYMKKYNKVYGAKIRWVNYNTKVKDIYFRLEVTKHKASFSFDLQHKDEGLRELFYEQFTELKAVITDSFVDELTWEQENETPYGINSSIYTELEGVSVFNKNDWLTIFPFLERNIVAAHDFWADFGEIFKNLEN